MQQPTLLQINTSLSGNEGQSTRLANEFVARWQQANPNASLVVRDLAADPLPHLSGERFQAFLTAPQDRSPEQAAIAAQSQSLIDELKAADIIVVGLPMYNFGIPSTLKAWIDHIARAGLTFKYTEQGAVGLLADRKVILFAARGGHYQGTAQDTQTGYMTTFLNFIGLHDIEFIYAEGLALGDSQQKQSLSAAIEAIDSLVNKVAA